MSVMFCERNVRKAWELLAKSRRDAEDMWEASERREAGERWEKLKGGIVMGAKRVKEGEEDYLGCLYRAEKDEVGGGANGIWAEVRTGWVEDEDGF
jgi:hypothetical protein